ncbi:MAG TPA: porin family protein [Epsilonproteobacteria bacterium]|nr:porin family protein [Campylobacterota bacterium]
MLDKGKRMHTLKYIGYLCLVSGLTLHAGGNKNHTLPETLPLPIAPAISDFYIGAGAGKFTLKNTDNKEELSSKTGTLIVGYDVHRHFSLEGRYTRSFNDISYDSGNLLAPNTKLDATFTNIALYAKLGYQFEKVKPYILLGYGESKITNLSFSDRKEAGFQYGAGLSYTLSPHWELFGDYVRAYDDKGFDGRSRADRLTLDMATFGFNYRF